MTSSVTRLHITPLNPETLSTILSSDIRKLATNISYHTLQTLPDSSYGYVDLPVMQAEKVRKKLNGAILKGKKMRVEEARPTKRKYIEETAENNRNTESAVPEKKRKKPKKDPSVISGHELSPERKVKRGWTEPKVSKSSKKLKEKSSSAAKPQSSSKYTEKPELLFRTKVPKNRSPQLEKGHKSKRKLGGGLDLVHEFEKSTKVPSFLRSESTPTKTGLTYQDGVGWVDEEGHVVEKEGERTSKKRKAAQRGIDSEVIDKQGVSATQLKKNKITAAEEVADDLSTSNYASESETNSKSGEATAENKEQSDESDQEAESTSSSGSSTSDTASIASLGSATSNTTEKNLHAVEAAPNKLSLHPLEALFKKPVKPASLQTTTTSSQDNVKPSLEIQTSFSFFDQTDDQDTHPPMPMTPFSSQDLRSRESRSAAPTPDTAHPSRMSSIFNGEDSDGDLSELEDSSLGDQPISRRSPSVDGQGLRVPQTDFEKQFWEKRGENNRAWKARRRNVLKEKRQRENRARRPKNW